MVALPIECSGQITYYSAKKYYGFITDDRGEEYFFHLNAFASDGEPESGRRVLFRPSDKSLRGPGNYQEVARFQYDPAYAPTHSHLTRCPRCDTVMVLRDQKDEAQSKGSFCPLCEPLELNVRPTLWQTIASLFYPALLILLAMVLTFRVLPTKSHDDWLSSLINASAMYAPGVPASTLESKQTLVRESTTKRSAKPDANTKSAF